MLENARQKGTSVNNYPLNKAAFREIAKKVETRRKSISKATEKYHAEHPELRQQTGEGTQLFWRIKFNSPMAVAIRKKFSFALSERQLGLDFQKKRKTAHSARMSQLYADPEFLRKRNGAISKAMKALHAKPEFREKFLREIRKRIDTRAILVEDMLERQGLSPKHAFESAGEGEWSKRVAVVTTTPHVELVAKEKSLELDKVISLALPNPKDVEFVLASFGFLGNIPRTQIMAQVGLTEIEYHNRLNNLVKILAARPELKEILAR